VIFITGNSTKLVVAESLHVDADVKLTHRADWILTRGSDALSVVVGV
jgi:hypothetical protein